MTRLVLALIASCAVGVPAAQAAERMGGCPQGYVAFDKQTGDGGPPAYRQGEAVVASGVITNLDAGVTEVSLRWGSADGPELGRAAVGESGTWMGLAFTIPQDAVDGEQQVFYVARDGNGAMLPGLPYPFAIRVGNPVVAVARQPEASPAVEAAAPTRDAARKATVGRGAVPKTTAQARDTARKATATTPVATSDAARRAPARSSVRRAVRVAPVAAAGVAPLDPSSTPVAIASSVPAKRFAPRQRRSRLADAASPVASRPAYDGRGTYAPARRAAPAVLPDTPVRGERGVADARWIVVLVALAMLALAAGLATRRRLVRERRVSGDESRTSPVVADAHGGCPIELELQEMIATHRPDGAERDPIALG